MRAPARRIANSVLVMIIMINHLPFGRGCGLLEREGHEEGKMQLKPGARLVSQACQTQVVVVRAPEGPVDLRCGGHPMVAADAEVAPAELSADHSSGTQLGKRYGDDEIGLQLLCTRPGAGSLSIGDTILARAEAKPLPSSD